jgi:hypothetical protein
LLTLGLPASRRNAVRTGFLQGQTNGGKPLDEPMPHPNVFRFEEHPEAHVFPRTTPEAISAMSRRLGIRVLTDWASFLLERNGYDFNTVTVGRPLQAPYKFADTALYLFGIGTGFEFNDIDQVLSDETRLERAYRQLLTPIGLCAGGNLLVQITAGQTLGRVVMINHSIHVNMGPDVFERTARRKLTDADKGTVIDLMIRNDLLIPLAPSLLAFFRLLIVEADSDGTVINVQISYDEQA